MKLKVNTRDPENQQIFRVQNTVAIIIFTVGTAVTIINFLHNPDEKKFIAAVMEPTVMGVFLPVLAILITGFIDSKYTRLLQLAVGYAVAAFTIMDKYDAIFGTGLYILFSIIAFKFGFFRKFTFLKIVLMIGAFYALIITSAQNESTGFKLMRGIDSILYVTVFLVVLYVIYSSEIKEYMTRTKAAEDSVVEMIKHRNVLEKELKVLNRTIREMQKSSDPLDFEAIGITERERDVLMALVVYGDTSKEIAERLQIGYETVKTHLKHIRDKLGVDRREEIIDLCRNNFIKEGNKQ